MTLLEVIGALTVAGIILVGGIVCASFVRLWVITKRGER